METLETLEITEDSPNENIFKKQPLACSVKKVFLNISQNSQENTCTKAYFLIKLPEACNFIKRNTLAKMLFCEFCELFKNTFFTENLRVTASDIWMHASSCNL